MTALTGLVGCSSDSPSSDVTQGAGTGGSTGSGGGSGTGGSTGSGGRSPDGGDASQQGQDAASNGPDGSNDGRADTGNGGETGGGSEDAGDASVDDASNKPIDAGADASAKPDAIADVTCEASTCSGAGTQCQLNSPTLDTCAVDSKGCAYLVSSVLCTTNVAHATAACTGTSCGFKCDANYVPNQGACVPPAPTPVSPLSGAFVGTRLTTLKWKLPNGFSDVYVEVCADRACTSVLYSADVTGTQKTVTTELPKGIVFWRVTTKDGATKSTLSGPVWEMELGGNAAEHNAPLTTGWGVVPDFNGDGFADVVMQTRGTGNFTKIYPSGQGGLGTALTLPAGPSGPGMNNAPPIGDFNGDGYVDLVIANGDLSVYNGSTTGLPASASQTINVPGGGIGTLATGDINGDGHADLFYPSETPPDIDNNSFIALNVYYGSPSGLSIPVTTTTTAVLAHLWQSNNCDLADVNGDGFADALVANQASGSPGSTASGLVFMGSASGLGTTPTTLAAVSGPGGNQALIASAGDVNGDGYVDVLLGASNLKVFHGGSNGVSTTAATTLSSGILNNGIFPAVVPALGDINGDGYADVVVPGTTSPYVTIYIGSNNGLVSGSPVSLAPAPPNGYMLADGASSPVNPVGGAADTNRDGYPDFGYSAVWQNGTSGTKNETYVFPGGSPIPTATSSTLSLGAVAAIR